jgi:hypothetical protein
MRLELRNNNIIFLDDFYQKLIFEGALSLKKHEVGMILPS